MKRTYVLIAVGLVLIAAAIFNFTLNIENKGHYFGNGVVCGIGISVIVVQILKMRKGKI
ncbi:MAG: hypothetical protein H3C36_07885 [Chitinophagaceae bacterium]|nr:hypothetical protein [Chitinophagaceae bacterium]MCW5913255.1 hypothetical protein [Chitinophagaceae bacterium]MCZ2397047.1 hypothetical protein [Chitinophagales bacterium]